MAAVLASGENAALSHLSAAYLWRLLEPRQGPAHVSVPSRAGRARRSGIVIHRCAALDPTALTERRAIPVTTPAKTIADLRGTVPPSHCRRAIRQAEVLGLRTGLDPSAPTRSELEHLFLRLCERHRLPKPEVNVRVGPYEVDFLWRERRLVVETDGYRYHRGSQAFEDDRERELELHSRGYTLRRFTYRQVTETPNRVAAALQDLKLD
jgi:very-short-patch-repair endonuclease